MTFHDSVLDHSCPNCGSPAFRLQGLQTPVAKVVCSECNMVLGTWRDFKQAVKDERRSQPNVSRRPRSRPRSETVDVWSKLRVSRTIGGEAADGPLLDRDAQAAARAGIGYEFP
jgi:uncharacterized Zn finger protein (UPF0148 family)